MTYRFVEQSKPNSHDSVGLDLQKYLCILQSQPRESFQPRATMPSFAWRIFAIKKTFNVLSMRMHMCCGFRLETRAIYGLQNRGNIRPGPIPR